MADRGLCGAKNRQGKPCRQRPTAGSVRCKWHGGKSLRKHGIYAAVLTAEEQAAYDQIPIGRLDDELKIARIRLMRALAARKLVDDGPDDLENRAGMEIAEVKQKTSQAGAQTRTETEVSRRRTDYEAIIDRYLGRIGSLERTRAELLTTMELDNPDEVAQHIQDTVLAMHAATIGASDGTE